ncbi:MAG TPA: hypothetical protein VFV75_03160 [Candidatus Polarisedimenticolaceae bacterium]|nr:hypothetical protein [Candidatus Polarisedimenticolaceae bacterium]
MARDGTSYDPEEAPDPEAWLALDESERIDLALRHHRRAGVKLPDPRVHAVIHNVVETQIAMGEDAAVRGTILRLQREGLDRHEAIHAVGSVLVRRIYDLVQNQTPANDPNDAYRAELERLSAKEWRRARTPS